MLSLLKRREQQWPLPTPGHRLLLRPLQPTDVDSIREWLKNKEITRLAFGSTADPSVLDRLARDYCKEIESGRRNALALWTPDGRFIGFVRFSLRRSGLRRLARVGIMIGDPRYLGQGYGTEAMEGFLTYLFQRRKVDRVELDTADFNVRAQRCFEKCGFEKKREQTLIQLEDGRPSTKVWMELSRDTWRRRGTA